MSKIQVMDTLLSNKIAAGEVVERCASVVKELVENSCDAKSSEIKIELKEAGTLEIKVTDNGIGMDRDDAILCFDRHATSKIKTEDDLFHITTLGFRGEALASIASVSKVELKTSEGDTGTLVNIEGGEIISVGNCEARKGTTITIRNLFYNTPARLKHMKSLYTELSSITDYVNKISLTHPEIKFVLTNNGSVILNTDGSNNLLKNIKCIYGIDVAKRMIEVSATDDDYNISGYISLPEIHRSNKNGMITLVNGRVVKNTELNKVINDSYSSYKPDNRFPIVVLNIEVDPILVDVNIHPTKMDVKFSKFEELKELISNMIKEKLRNINLIPNIEATEKIEKPKYEKYTLNFNVEEETEEYRTSNIQIDQKIDENEYILNEDLFKNEVISEEKKQEQIELDKDKLPEMYPIGEVHGTYIITQNESGMYIIDQHAAKERINYEICLNKLANPNDDKIDMLIPLTLEYSNNDYLVLKENIEFLNEMNFDIEPFGINSIIVKAHPTWIPKNNEVESIKKVIEMVIEKEKNFDLAKFRNHVAATMACKMSIKANDLITLKEMENLINDLRKCNNPFNCPHGRPTIIYYSKEELEKLFKRSGF